MTDTREKSGTRFIIVAPPFDEYSGGAIVLHKLCHMLNGLGQQAFMWPLDRKLKPSLSRRVKALWKNMDFRVNPDFCTPIASVRHVDDDAIVVYPEIITGNPLGAKNIVRWLLHKPGFHTGVVEFGANELFFAFDEYSASSLFKDCSKNILFVAHLNDNYRDDRQYERRGSCYMIRKAKNVRIQHDLTDSIQIDNLSHAEVAEIFRKTKFFFCYDEMTMYSQFAALCGCISVVIPSEFRNRDEWVAVHPISKYGIAYGLEDIQHALDTRHKVREYFAVLEQQSLRSVICFTETAIIHFFKKHTNITDTALDTA